MEAGRNRSVSGRLAGSVGPGGPDMHCPMALRPHSATFLLDLPLPETTPLKPQLLSFCNPNLA